MLTFDVWRHKPFYIYSNTEEAPDRILSEECGRGLRFKCCGLGCLHPLADGDGGDEDVDFADATLLQEIGERKERGARRHQIIDEEDALAP